MNIINLTPHTITIQPDGGDSITIAPTGTPARVEQHDRVIEHVAGIPVVMTTYSEVTGLPEPQPDTIYIVSGLVMTCISRIAPERDDVYAPDTGPDSAIRDDTGNIVAVKRLRV